MFFKLIKYKLYEFKKVIYFYILKIKIKEF